MERFDQYWKMGEDGKALPYRDGIEVKTIADSTALFAALKAGEVDVYWQLPQKFAHTIKDDRNVRPIPTAFNTQHFYFVYEHQRTTGDNVFGDIRARRALLLALDKDELSKVGFAESGIPLPTNQMILSTLPFGLGRFVSAGS